MSLHWPQQGQVLISDSLFSWKIFRNAHSHGNTELVIHSNYNLPPLCIFKTAIINRLVLMDLVCVGGTPLHREGQRQ